jgi:uncharacterized protein YeaO (DUF488 family)
LIKIKRIYEKPQPTDGLRILVDRLWPRGISKNDAKIDLWLKEIAPSNELRKWYNHDPKKWKSFQEKYQKELSQKEDSISLITKLNNENKYITLLYSSKEEKLNNAVALKELLDKKVILKK